MNYHPMRYIIMRIVILALVLVTINGAMVLAQGPQTVFVTSPTNSETVSGIVTVTGVVDFWDFLKYEVFLKTGDQLVWGATVYAPVINGNLARLDTKTVMDGTYQLVIRLVRTDSNYTDYDGPTITITNNLGAPVGYPEIDSSYLYTPLSNHAVARIRNCSGLDLEFDYVGDTFGCSAGNLWIKAKTQDMPLCSTADILLSPCKYRGTAVGLGEERGVSYELDAAPGKAYIIEFAGEARMFINETTGDERAETDTGGLIDLTDTERFQNVSQVAVEPASQVEAASAPAEVEVASAPTEVETAPVDASSESTETQAVLPESGQAATETSSSFVITAIGLILLMIIGGLAAMRRGKQIT